MNLLTVLSLLLCVGAGAAWARSYVATDRLVWAARSRDGNIIRRRIATVSAGRGGVACTFFSASDVVDAPQEFVDLLWKRLDEQPAGLRREMGPAQHPADGGLVIERWTPPAAAPADTFWNRHGFFSGFARGAGAGAAARNGRTVAYAIVPLWFVFLIMAQLPALRGLALWRRWCMHRRRRRAGLCPRCAYDLRATAGLCPECGSTAGVSQ